MTDVFLSYSRRDEARADQVRDALTAADYEVFWDKDLKPGTPDWDATLRAVLAQAKAVVVLWSANSVASNAVKHEVEIAVTQGKLIPVMLERLTVDQMPMGQWHQQAAIVSDWDGADLAHPELTKLVAAVANLAGPGTFSTRKAAVERVTLNTLRAENSSYQQRIAELSATTAAAEAAALAAAREKSAVSQRLAEVEGRIAQAVRRATEAERVAQAAESAAGRRAQAAERPITHVNGMGWKSAAGVFGAGLVLGQIGVLGFAWSLVTAPFRGGETAKGGAVTVTLPAATIVDGATITQATLVGTVFKDCEVCPQMVVVPYPAAEGSTEAATIAAAPIATSTATGEPTVRAPRVFAVGRFEITLGEYRAFSPGLQYREGCGSVFRNDEAVSDPLYPATCVTRSGADPEEYLEWLSALTEKIYRLPTASEFRGYSLASNEDRPSAATTCATANFLNAENESTGRNIACSDPFPSLGQVGQLAPNSLGLYDVFGNAAEALARERMDNRSFAGGGYASVFSNPNGDLVDYSAGFRVVREIP